IEITGFVDAVAEKRVKTAEEILNAFIKYHPHLGHSLTPHSPYSVSKTLFNLLNEKTAGQIISIHNQEASAENELYQQKTGALIELYKDLGINLETFTATGKTSMQSWSPYFNRGQKVISVHNTFTSEDDIKTCDLHMAYCICINANLYIENSLPPIEMLMKNDCFIVLGTDSYASNHSLNIMEEINSIQKHFPTVPLATILQWATINGAKALGIENRFGSFEKGKIPGLVLIDVVNGLSKKMV
ncbi:MAG TPA: amidohydrolase family protein, partial [Ferruginibacter sp.]|nr:amidohydrolase family protein [Ferruginibacter sp.]